MTNSLRRTTFVTSTLALSMVCGFVVSISAAAGPEEREATSASSTEESQSAATPQSYTPRQQSGLPNGGHFHFTLIKGQGTEVCEAYVRRLNASTFTNYPPCDRPEDDSVAGFKRLIRVPLSAAEIAPLFDAVEGFPHFNDPEFFAKHDAWLKAQNRPVTTNRAESAIRSQEGRVRNQVEMLAYRYVPELDVDNDGSPDHIVVWRQTGFSCGSTKYRYPEIAQTWMVLLDDRGHLDVERTRRLFEHPDGIKYTVRDAKSGATRTYELPSQFHGIGTSLGLFRYQGQTYFDTFYNPTGDLQNERGGTPDISITLAVFQAAGSTRTLRCEIVWQDKIGE